MWCRGRVAESYVVPGPRSGELWVAMSHSFAPRAQKLVRKLCLELLKSSKKSAARICRYAARYAAAWSANVLDASLSGSTARVYSPPASRGFTRRGGGASITIIPAEREDSAGFYIALD